MANYIKWSLPLQEEIRKAIVAELRKIAEENPLPEYTQFRDESINKLDTRYNTYVIRNNDKLYIGTPEVENVSK